ncbi:MAG: hypothetical protein Q8R30_04820 [bacterium]|nr:hypothetical protein [bacterium]MDZ4286290.1 hypothetical protein [Candidatus Sungbacteria bacterium]
MSHRDLDVHGKEEVTHSSSGEKSAIDWKLIVITGMVALGMLWFNVSVVLSVALFMVKAFAIFLLIFGGWYSVLLVCRPRRIVTDEQTANKITWHQFMIEMQQSSPFMRSSHSWDSSTEQKTVTSWDLRKGFLTESSASLLWLLAIIFLTLTAHRYMPLYVVAALATATLCVNWIKYLLLYDRWSGLSQEAAKTEHYGLWLVERIQYGCVLLYCLDFAAYRAGLF